MTSYTAYVPQREPDRVAPPPEPPRTIDKYLAEAATHARLRVFPNSAIGQFIYQELDFYSRHEWSPSGPAVALAREVYRLQEAGFVLNGAS